MFDKIIGNENFDEFYHLLERDSLGFFNNVISSENHVECDLRNRILRLEIAYEDMSNEFNYQGYDFMVCNNRGAEQFFRLHKKVGGKNETIKAGNIYENFDESIYDISAMVNYAKELGMTHLFTKAHSDNIYSIRNILKDGYKIIDNYENERGTMTAFIK